MANDIATLLPEFDALDWEWFKGGYISARPLDGQYVVNFIETGREQKGVTLLATDPASALPLLLQELDESLVLEDPDLFASYVNLGLCYSLLSLHPQAVAAYEKAQEYFDEAEDVSLKMLLHHNFGIALHRMEDYFNAAKQLEFVRNNQEIIETAPDLYKGSLLHLFDCYIKMGRERQGISTCR